MPNPQTCSSALQQSPHWQYSFPNTKTMPPSPPHRPMSQPQPKHAVFSTNIITTAMRPHQFQNCPNLHPCSSTGVAIAYNTVSLLLLAPTLLPPLCQPNAAPRCHHHYCLIIIIVCGDCYNHHHHSCCHHNQPIYSKNKLELNLLFPPMNSSCQSIFKSFISKSSQYLKMI